MKRDDSLTHVVSRRALIVGSAAVLFGCAREASKSDGPGRKSPEAMPTPPPAPALYQAPGGLVESRGRRRCRHRLGRFATGAVALAGLAGAAEQHRGATDDECPPAHHVRQAVVTLHLDHRLVVLAQKSCHVHGYHGSTSAACHESASVSTDAAATSSAPAEPVEAAVVLCALASSRAGEETLR